MTVWYVDDNAALNGVGSASRPMRYLGDAIEALRDGDTIRIAAGRYGGNHTITEDNITLIGAGPSTIIQGGSVYGLRVQGDDFRGVGLRIMDNDGPGAIAIDTDGFALRDCFLQRNTMGAYVRGGDNYRFVDNVFSHNGTHKITPGENPQGVGLSIHNPCSETPGWDGTVHILVQGNAFHYNQGTVRSTENHGFILDFYTNTNPDGSPRIANPWNYKQEILVRWNDAAFNGKSGFIVHMASQNGAVNPDFITYVGNRAWNNGQDDRPNSSDFRTNVSEGIKYINNSAFDNGAMGNDHFSFHVGSSSDIYMKGNIASSGLHRVNSSIQGGGGNQWNVESNQPEYDWAERGRAYWNSRESMEDNKQAGVDALEINWSEDYIL